jgi:hypothetical protein
MATVTQPPSTPLPLELHSGDRMTREEFHRIYKQMPNDFKAELIGGIVYVASPLRLRHATDHLDLGVLFGVYRWNTPGVEAGDNATVLLSDEDEPQPDLFLRILPQYGGQSRTTGKGYIDGAPELLAEIAYSSRAIDLHKKKDQYTAHGVCEYIVACVREKQLRWFDLRAGQEFTADAEGVFRSQLFPGLWVHNTALFARDYQRLMATLNQGLAMPEHTAFVNKLSASQTPPRSSS